MDTGRLYIKQRQLQKIADMAALETVSRLPDGNCASEPQSAIAYATENATRNGFIPDDMRTLSATCVTVSSHQGLRQGVADNSGHAVQVHVSHRIAASLFIQVASLINGDNGVATTTLSAQAIAERQTPTASFSVASQLLRLDDNLVLGSLLSTVGLDANYLSALDAGGLATLSVTPSGLLHALGVDLTLEQLQALSPQGLIDLVNTEVGLLGVEELIDLSLELVSDDVLITQLALLQTAISNDPMLEQVDIALFGTGDDNALVTLTGGSEEPLGAAMTTEINLGELVASSLMQGYQGRGLMVPELDVLGLANVTLGIVEPPSIGIGPVGTTAHDAQIRLYIDVDTDNLLSGALDWLTGMVLDTRIHLPIWIDLTSGQGALVNLDCSTETPTADIRLQNSILNMCVGEVPDLLKWSTANSCQSAVSNTELIRLLGLPVLSGKTEVAGLEHTELFEDMSEGDTRSSQPNPLQLGDTVDNMVAGLLDLLSGLFSQPSQVPDDSLDYNQENDDELIADLAKQYLNATKVNGLYNIDAVLDLILIGSNETDSSGNQILPPLVNSDWLIENSIPTSCLLTVCPQSQWHDGTFSEAFTAYATPGGLLDLLGISTLSNGYMSCGGLLSALLAWNSCLEHNLTKLLRDKPGGINITQSSDSISLANPATDSVNCTGAICLLLQPVLELLKPTLNGIGHFLDTVLADALGLELGRTDVNVQAISCGAPRLVY